MPSSPRILVVRRRYLGDIVLLGSLFRNLRLQWPESRLAALVEAPYAPVLSLNPDVDAIMPAPAGATAWPRFLSGLRRHAFSHVLDLDNTEKTALVSRLSGARTRVALHHGNHPVRLRALYSHVVYDPGDEHEAHPISDYYLKSLQAIDVPVTTREIRLVPREEEVADWRRFVGAQGRTLLVHPGSRSRWRLWPAERFAAVCDHVQDALGVQVVLTGGPAERALVEEIRSLAKTHLLVLEQAPSLSGFAALAKASSVLLCHDSGPMHLAAAVGTPVVALYGSQNPALFRPVGEGHELLIPPLPCTECVAPDLCRPDDSYHNYCVRRLTTGQVCAAVERALARRRP
ncbi:MAG TPA: glycosyltransferase family 9 protein [Opitutaceae bacterium]